MSAADGDAPALPAVRPLDGDGGPAPAAPDPSAFRRDTLVVDAFAGIIEQCTAQILGHAATLRTDADTEALHQMRIGIRKLRTALKVFRRDLVPEAVAELECELRWLQDETGPSRDWHTYVEEFLAKLKPHATSSELTLLETLARARLVAAQERHARMLREQRYASLVALLQRWREQARSLLVLTAGMELRDYAHAVLKRARRKARDEHSRLEELDLAQLHKLRIRVKNLRYMTELFSALGRPREVKRYLRELKSLQTRLGRIHDAVVARDLTAELRGESSGRDHASGLVQGWSAAVLESERSALLVAGTRLRKPPV